MVHMIGITFKGAELPITRAMAEVGQLTATYGNLFLPCRVFNLATTLAKSEESIKDIELVQLAALLHDIDDWKYSGRCAPVLDYWSPSCN